MTEPTVPTDFLLNNVNTSTTVINFTANTTTGLYNETVDVRAFDIFVKTKDSSFKNTIKLPNVNLSTNYFNPIVFGSVPRLRTTLSALKGVYVDTIFNSSNSTIAIDFSSCVSPGCGFSIINPNNLGIYKYTGNWTPKISSAQNTLWSRIANVPRDNSDGSVNISAMTATVQPSSLKGVYILAEFICGDGSCETNYGESSNNCASDCPSLPPVPITGGAGGAGAPGVAAPTPTAPVVIPPPVPLEVRSTLLETTLVPGEEKVFSVDVTNHRDAAISTTIVAEGPIFNLLTIQKPAFTIQAKTTEFVAIKAFAPETSVPGIYTGDLVVTAGNIIHRIPVTIRVVAIDIPLLDVKVKALSKTVSPGGKLIFEISLINMGETATVDDITTTYSVKSLAEEGRIILSSSDTVAVDNILTYRRELDIPNNVPQERYLIEANATYWFGTKYALSSDNFDVTTLPLPLQILRSAFLNPLTYILLFVGLPAAIIGARYYATYRSSKLAKSRYIAPIDFKALPQAGPNAIEAGRIAETDIRAYVDTPQLLMHSIAAGGSGSGKSVSAMVMAEELLKRKVPIVVFDPTAQWTGFMKPNRLKAMLDLYPKFGLKPTDARSFKTNIIVVENPDMAIDIKKYMIPGDITVFVMNRLPADKLDNFVRRSIQSIFDMRPQESKEMKLMLVYDEVHRLLPKYGGKGGYVAIERACREFRKWGIGVFLISQVLLDFKGAIRANIANEIQLRTKYEGDIGRVKSKYGMDYASKVTRLTIGTGLFQNPEYNRGRPWFISFRPLLHSPFALTDTELDEYIALSKRVDAVEAKIKEMKAGGTDTYDIEIELNIVKDKIKTAAFKMAATYLDAVEKRLQQKG